MRRPEDPDQPEGTGTSWPEDPDPEEPEGTGSSSIFSSVLTDTAGTSLYTITTTTNKTRATNNSY